MTSSRRVRKGPGRRPQSAKRQRFMELRARGWSVRAAAREVGVSRLSGANWSRGYKTYPQRDSRRIRTRVGPVGCPPDQQPIPLAGRTHRDRRPPPGRIEYESNRHRYESSAADELTRTAPQSTDGCGYRLSTLTVSPPLAGHVIIVAESTPAPGWVVGRLTTRPAVEPTTDQPAFA